MKQFLLIITLLAFLLPLSSAYGDVELDTDTNGAVDVNLGVWAGNLAATTTTIGAATTAPVQVWHGGLRAYLIDDRAYTPAEVADLAVVP